MKLVTIKSIPGEPRAGWEGDENATHWKCRLMYEGRKLKTTFSMGSAHTGEPEAQHVLSCLLTDARAGQESLRDFCRDLGYDEDSRKASRIWHVCRKLGPKLREFLGAEMWEKAQLVNQEEFAKYLVRGTTADPVKEGEKATGWYEFTIEDHHGDDRKFRARLVFGFDTAFSIKHQQDPYFHSQLELQELNVGVEIWASGYLEDAIKRLPEKIQRRFERLQQLNFFGANKGPQHYLSNSTYWFELACGLKPRSESEQLPAWLNKVLDAEARERTRSSAGMTEAAKKKLGGRRQPTAGQWFMVFEERFKSSCCFGLLDPELPFPWNDKLPADPNRDFPRPHATALMSDALKGLQKESMHAWLVARHPALMEAAWTILTAEGFDREAICRKKVTA